MTNPTGTPAPPGRSAHLASRLEDRLQRSRATRALRRGKVARILPFRGYGSTTWIRILARVVIADPPRDSRPSTQRIRGWRSFTSPPLPFASVTVTVDDQTFEVTADRGGVIDTTLPATLEPGWHTVWLRSGNEWGVRSRIFIVADDQRVGIVCDIDDTVMVTALPRPLLAAWNTFVLDEHARRPVPGMAVLLDRLARFYPGCPVIYLSTGAWNVQPTLSRFLSRHLYPRGSLLLTDWGPTHDRWFRSGRAHKIESLERLAREFPAIQWILIGDDGQHDEDIYGHFATRHPNSVRAIAIRELLTPEALLAGGRSHRNRTDDPDQIPWVSAPDGAGLASELAKNGIVDTPLHSPE